MFRRRRTLTIILRIAAMFFAGAAVAVIIAVLQINPESFRGEIQSAFQAATRLPVEIDGKLSWRISLRPSIAIESVRVPNADWAKNKDGVNIGKIVASFNLFSLVYKNPEIERLRIEDLKITAERNQEGQWSVWPDLSNEPDHTDKPAHDKKFPFNPNVGLKALEIRGAEMILVHDGHKDNWSFNTFKIETKRAKDSLEYSGYLSKNSSVSPFVVSFSPLNTERKVYPVKLAIANNGETVIANIALEETSKIPIDFVLTGAISDLQSSLAHFDISFPKIAKIKMNVAGGFGRGKLTLRKSSLQLGNSDLEISGSYDWSGRTTTDLKLKSKRLAISDVFPDIYKPSKPSWVRPKRDLNVFRDIPVADYFPKETVSLKADVSRLEIYKDFILTDAKLDAASDGKAMHVNAAAENSGGQAKVAAIIHNYDGVLDITTAGVGDGIKVGEIMNAFGENRFISEMPAKFGFYIKANGRDLTEIVSNATGPVQVYSTGKGYAKSDLLEHLYGQDFLISLKNSVQDLFRSSKSKKNDEMKIDCAAFNVKLRRGKIDIERGVAVETAAINMRATGNINFGKEKIKLALVAVPVRGVRLSVSGNVINSMEFSGNLAEPEFKINGNKVVSKALSATGIGLLLAPFTGGLSIVAGAGVGFLAGDLLENWLSDEHPCKTAKEHGAPSEKGDPEFLNRPLAELINEMIPNGIE